MTPGLNATEGTDLDEQVSRVLSFVSVFGSLRSRKALRFESFACTTYTSMAGSTLIGKSYATPAGDSGAQMHVSQQICQYSVEDE